MRNVYKVIDGYIIKELILSFACWILQNLEFLLKEGRYIIRYNVKMNIFL